MPELRYQIPDLEDPVVLVAALSRAGYRSESQGVQGTNYLVVECPEGTHRERDEVRALIRDASATSIEGPEMDVRTVTFEDERDPGMNGDAGGTGSAPRHVATPSEEEAMADSTDLVSVIIDDHRSVEQVFKELEGGQGSPEHRRSLADHVISELVRHSVAEEQHMYPAARKVLDDGDDIADHELEEHAEAEKVMKELEGVDATDAKFDELLGKLIADVRHHIEDEEQDLLPRLQSACSREELEELGEKVLKAKKVAPTHPHPAAPDKPPANKLLGPGAGLVDRIRDKLSS